MLDLRGLTGSLQCAGVLAPCLQAAPALLGTQLAVVSPCAPTPRGVIVPYMHMHLLDLNHWCRGTARMHAAVGFN